ncbi:MAG: nitronate monooxygenase, partial [Planctomycetota bacterium]
MPDPAPVRNAEHEKALRKFLGRWGPEVEENAADKTPPDFQEQCQALLDVKPMAVSSIMGVYQPDFVSRLKDRGIRWIANASTVHEAKLAEAEGADIIVAKSMEAGGHSGAFSPEDGLRQAVGAMSLIPAIADAVSLPVIATGGIADARTAMAALTLGASAVQIGTGFLRAPEAKIAT